MILTRTPILTFKIMSVIPLPSGASKDSQHSTHLYSSVLTQETTWTPSMSPFCPYTHLTCKYELDGPILVMDINLYCGFVSWGVKPHSREEQTVIYKVNCQRKCANNVQQKL